jgi:hypothetical protein
LIEQYPGTEEAKKASEMLDAMKKIQAATDTIATTKEKAYEYTPDVQHAAMIVVPNARFDINKLKTKLSDFNAANFKLETYEISTVLLDRSYQLCMVKFFKNKKLAQSYIQVLENNTVNTFAEFPAKEFKYFVITEENLVQLIKQRLIDPYAAFYDKYYR